MGVPVDVPLNDGAEVVDAEGEPEEVMLADAPTVNELVGLWERDALPDNVDEGVSVGDVVLDAVILLV